EFNNMNLYKIILYPTILLVFAFSYACQINHEDPGPGTIFLENAGNEKVFFEDVFELVDSFSFVGVGSAQLRFGEYVIDIVGCDSDFHLLGYVDMMPEETADPTEWSDPGIGLGLLEGIRMVDL